MTADWQNAGLCLVPAYIPLFGDRRPAGMSREQRNAAAKGVCDRCPSEMACLAWTLQQEGTAGTSGRAGVAGGKTAAERAALAGADGSDDEDGAR